MSEKSLKDKIADKATSIGALMALFGVLSSVLYFFDYNMRALMWVDAWGTAVGWIIRVGFIVGGGAVALLAGMFDESNSPEAQAAEAQKAQEAFEAEKSHPRTQAAFADLCRRFRVSWDPPSDPDTYRIRRLLWQDAKYRWTNETGTRYLGPDDAVVTGVLFYLERNAAPRRLVVGQNFTTWEITQQEPLPGAWETMVSA